MIDIISGLRGVKINGKHNKEFGIAMESASIGFPAKKKIKETVPFMNGYYDFSTIGSNGEIMYEEREIDITFGIPAQNKEELQYMYSQILEWCVDISKSQIIFDSMPDYYFEGEVTDSSTLEETMAYGKLQLKFTCEPFKKSITYIGDCLWDPFNFEEDYLEDSTFVISGSGTVGIHNPGRSVRPIINCSAPATMTHNGKTYNLVQGDNEVYGFYFTSGFNQMVINTNGTISFRFRKETL